MAKGKNNTRRANLILGGITLGFLLSYPFHTSFVGGLIASGCSAGMIGGLADWFAVTALFRRPLGIRPGKIIRTEIIPQNRERIFTALAAMVQDELLSQDVLRRKLSAWDFSGVLIRILRKQEVKLSAGLLLTNLAEDLVKQIKPGELTQIVLDLLQQNLSSMNLSQTLAAVLEFSLDHGDVNRVLESICQAINEYIEQPEVNVALKNIIEAALRRYGENNTTRKMLLKFLPTPSVLAYVLQTKVKTALQDGTVARLLKDSLLRFVTELKTKPSLQERTNHWCLNFAAFMGTSMGKKTAIFEHFIKNIPNILLNNWDGYLTKFEGNHSLRLKVDARVKLILEKQIELHHNAIGRMVREGLESLHNDKLVELIENKAGNDLQMIRINGSVVGGLAGMLIYVLGVVLS
ncbi:MAG: DUF445 domain-containing protein [Desulfosporosinus sp.]|jgi:uncharacterized membrane-anchored protein YjiN (DUF445 family)